MTEYLRRKIRAVIMSGSVRGSLRTASGYPLTLTDCKSIKSLTVYGNSGGVGDKTNNLFDKDITDASSWTRGVLDMTGSSNARYYIDITQYLTPGKEYTIDFEVKDNTDIPKYFYFTSDDGVIGMGCYMTANAIINKSKSFTVVEGKRYVIYSALGANNTAAANPVWADKFKWFRILEGAYTADTLPQYEPFGYKIPLAEIGKNLFNPDTVTNGFYITNRGMLAASDWWTTSDYMPVISEQVIVSEKEKGYFYQYKIAFYDKDKTFISFSESENYTGYAVLSAPQNAVYLRMSYSVRYTLSDGSAFSPSREELSVCAGSELTAYEPYNPMVIGKIFLTAPLNESDSVAMYYEDNKAMLMQASGAVDISSLQNWDSLAQVSDANTAIVANTAVAPSTMTAIYYSNQEV